MDRGPVSLFARVRVFLRDVDRIVSVDHLAMLFGADSDTMARVCAELVSVSAVVADVQPDTRRRGYRAVLPRHRVPRPIDPEIPRRRLLAELNEADTRFAARIGTQRFTP